MVDTVTPPPMPIQPSSPGVPEEATRGIDIAALTKQGEKAYASVPQGDRRSVDLRYRQGGNTLPPQSTALPAEPGPLPQGTKPSEAPPPPKPKPAPYKENDDLDPSVTGFFKWAWNGAKQGVEGAVPSLAAGAAETANVFLGMPAARAADAVMDVVHGRLPSSSGTHAAQDWMGDYYTKELKPAIDAWEPEAGNPIAAGAQGGTMLALTKIPGVGQVAGASMAAGTFTHSLTTALDDGHNAKQAISEATVDTLATLAIMKFVGKEGVGLGSIPYAWLRRAIAAVPIADAIGLGQDLAKKAILEVTGNHEAAKKIDPIEKLTDVGNIIQNEIFAILGGVHRGDQGGHQTGPKPPEPAPVKGAAPTLPPSPEGKTPPPPPPEPAPISAKESAISAKPGVPGVQPVNEAGRAAVAAATQPAAPAGVPDHPTGEPAKQIRAQLIDMNRSATPRQGVLITPETQAHLDTLGADHPQGGPVTRQLEQAREQGRTVQTPVGELVLKTKALAAGVKADLNAGKDPQEVIGRVTIAADGPKRPDQVQVVQHLEPHDGTITSEKAVTVNERGAEMQLALDSGKVPRVVTPDHVIAERQAGIEKEAPKRPPLRQGEDPAEALFEEQVRRDAEAAEKAAQGLPPREGVAAENAAPEPSGKGKAGFFKPENGEEVPVQVLEDGRVQRLDMQGEPVGEPIKVPEGSVRTGPKPLEPSTKPAEPVKGTALEQLPGVLEAHEKMEAVPEGKKKAASLKERQDNASAVATALKAAAKEAHEKGAASEAAVERAVKAANEAEGLTNISKENTEKGRGTGHVQVTAKVSEMHKAARELLGRPQAGDETRVPTKEAVLKSKLKRAAERVAAKEEQIKKVVKEVIKGGTEAIKKQHEKKDEKPELKVASRTDRKLTDQMTQGYLRAKTPEGAARRRAELEEHLHAVAEKLGQPRERVMELMNELDLQRGETRPQKMSDTLEDETHEFERPEEGFDTVYRPMLGGDKAGMSEWNKATLKLKKDAFDLGNSLEARGFFQSLRHLEDTGRPISARRLLETLIRTAEEGHLGSNPMTTMARHILMRIPDVPIYARSNIIRPPTGSSYGEGTVGLFHGSAEHPNVQIMFTRGGVPRTGPAVLHTILHELQHAATMLELQHNPNGELAQQARAARDILESRMRQLFGDEQISQHLAYFRDTKGEVEKPADFHPDWYGLTDEKEMMAELINPEFVEHIINSEMVARRSENLPQARGVSGLLHQIYSAVAKFFHMQDNPRLLMHILDIDMGVAKEQRLRFGRFYGDDAFKQQVASMPAEYTRNLATAGAMARGRGDVDPFSDLRRPAPMLKVEDTARSIVGDEGVKTARDTAHTIMSGTLDKARHAVTALETVGQIYREKTKYFGRYDDPENPLNQLRDAHYEKEKMIMAGKRLSNPVARLWQKLNNDSNRRVGQLMIDAGLYKIGLRPNVSRLSAADVAKRSPQFQKQYDELTRRYDALKPEERAVYDGAAQANKEMRALERRTAIDSAVEGFDLKVTPAERALLYGAKRPEDYDDLIGKGKPLDFAEKNDKVKSALKEWVGGRDIEGDYFHLGRQGNYVVQAKPEGTKEFGSKEEAERWADSARSMSPNSKADVENRGGKWVVDYKVDHVSMHKTRREAEQMQAQLNRGGFETGSVTIKNFDQENAPLSHGMTELMAEATRKLNRGGNPADVKPLIDSLHSAFLQMQAQRSAFGGSRLQRKGVGGVKASEMRQNFAEHATASMWHTAQLKTIFSQARALGRMRQMARDTSAPQNVAYERGETVTALANHMAEDVHNYGKFSGFNRQLARAGFLSYLFSPAHPAIWMTQNLYGISTAGAHYGYGRSAAAFSRGMATVFGPAMRTAMRGVFRGGANSDDIAAAIIKKIGEDPKTAKWAPAIKELYDRGVIQHGYANELGELSAGGNNKVSRVMEWARLLPSMADSFNRTSTALAGLELTGGDLRKTTDLIEQIHADYSQGNKPLAFKYAGRVAGGSSVTMMKTYIQSMAHMFYSNLAETVKGDTRQAKWEAAKTVAGMMVVSSLFAGVYGAVALEPIRLLAYVYHKIFDEEGDTWDMKTAMHHFLVDHFGAAVGNVLDRGPISAALGIDLKDRMGLANMFFWNPPDLLTTDKAVWGTFFMDELGPAAQMLVDGVVEATGHIQKGEYAQALASVFPIKVIKDGLKAMQLATTGKTNIRGAVQTQPSGLDAAKQAFGVKPASVADAQEKAGIMAGHSKAEQIARTNIIRALVAGKEGAEARRSSFNQRHPNAQIKPSDITSYRRGTMRQEQGITKDRAAAADADFSGR